MDDGGNGSIDRAESYVYDGADIVASLDAAGSLTHRYLHGPAVDQVFADEDALGEILWGLADNQGSIRDVVDYDAVSDTTTIANHRQFDSFGNMTFETNAAVDYVMAYTGAWLDEDTGLQKHGVRWLDGKTARWLSEDWIRDDTNTYRYAGNNPPNYTDPSGLAADDVIDQEGSAYWVSQESFWTKVKFKIGQVDKNNRFTDSLGLNVNVNFETLRRAVREFSTAKVCERFKTDAGRWSFIKGTIRSVQLREAEAARRIPVEGGFRLRPLTAEEKLGTNVDRYEMKTMRAIQWQARRDAGANAIHDTKEGIKREAANQIVSRAVAPLVVGKLGGRLLSRVWPKHHPFPKYLGGAANQTLKKIPRKLHYRFHSALDKWKCGKYARTLGAEYFKNIDKAEVIQDLTEFYKKAEGGIFKKYLPDFLQAVKESGY